MGVAYEIGPFRLDPTVKAVTRAGAPVALGSRAVAVLALLVESAREYVPKSRLMDEAWPGVVVEESNLAVQILAIRRALAQAPGGDNWIETLPRRGYRFVGPVTRIPDRGARDPGGGVRSNLPEPLTSFVGREREVTEIQGLLAGNRLLTLTGVGGVGKTRLAWRVAGAALDGYSDGVRLVELSALRDPDLVPQTVAGVLGLKDLQGKGLTHALTENLEAKCLLLVLDNAEHLVAACAQLIDTLLRKCPQVTVLVTTREPLRVPGERTYRVPSLSVPDPSDDITARTLVDYESVRLFSERARLRLPEFAVTDRNAPALADICRRLDGIPLAIELAAARVGSMSVEEVNQRLDQRFRLLTGGSRTLPHRQQTLRAAFDWSYELLDDAEKALLRRVAVFAGGWTVDAAEGVCAGDGIEAGRVLDLLTSLVDKSLVVPEVCAAATRYRLLETLHHYATERLRSADDHEEAARARHFDWYLRLAERVEPLILGGPQQKQALDMLEADRDNLRAALAWSLEVPDRADLALRLCGTLYRFWSRRGYWQEGYAASVKALAQASPTGDKAARAKVLLTAGSIGNNVPGAETRMLLEDALVLSREAGDRNTEATTLNNLARVLDWGVELSRARSLLEQSRRINRELGNKTLELHNMSNLVNVLRQQHDPAAALALAEEGLATSRSSGDRWLEGIFLYLLGRVALDRGDIGVAQRFHEQALAIARALVMPDWQSFSLVKLAFLAVIRGDPASARSLLTEAVDLSRRFGSRLNLSECFSAGGVLASNTGEHDQAARLWGMAEALLGSLSSSDVLDRELLDPYRAKSREALGDAAYRAAWAEGHALPRQKAISEALAWLAGAS